MGNRVLRPAWTRSSPRAIAERRARVDAQRDTGVRDLYRTPEWQRLRRQVLREEPLCRTRGCGAQSVIVDHTRPHRGNRALFFDRTNLTGRCKSCHDRKTARYDGGFGNPRKEPVR